MTEKSIADMMAESQDEDRRVIEERAAKHGPYTGDECPRCGRLRIMLGDDGGRRCEKCRWHIEAGAYDPQLG